MEKSRLAVEAEKVTRTIAERGRPKRASSYHEALNNWAGQYVPDGAAVTRVQIDYDDGYDPTFTDRPASLAVWIHFRLGPREGVVSREGVACEDATRVITSIGELLTELFAIEDATRLQ